MTESAPKKVDLKPFLNNLQLFEFSNEEQSKRVTNSMSKTEWMGLIDENRIPTDVLDQIVLNHLVFEGHSDVAKCFQEEAGLPGHPAIDAIDFRSTLRDHILKGEIGEAIELVKDEHPSFFDNDTKIPTQFRLKLQYVLEMIRTETDIDMIITYVHNELRPLVINEETGHIIQNELIGILESVLVLLTFKDFDDLPNEYKDYLTDDFKNDTGALVNADFLSHIGDMPPISQLSGSLQTLFYVEGCIRKSKSSIPSLNRNTLKMVFDE
ncbi:hypothetical protein PCE1_000148 [Barthelona sp. PCE]